MSLLFASDTRIESITLIAPENAGTYYYGACVQSVVGESNTDNNCSDAVRVTVSQMSQMYWTGTGKIQRANLDGSNIEDLATADLNYPRGLALDVAGGKIYWTDAVVGSGVPTWMAPTLNTLSPDWTLPLTSPWMWLEQDVLDELR